MSHIQSKRFVYGQRPLFIIAVLLLLLLTQSAAMAADVPALFQQARTTATQLSKDASIMESYARSNLSWKSHTAQVTRIKDHIDKAGSIVSQMQSARGDAEPWHQDAIDGLVPVLKELASNTESIITHLNDNPKRLKDPTYAQYLKSNSESASELSAAVGNVVDYDKTKTKMETLETKLGRR
jgi:hypothetical protein